jgi:hypothetical protein
MTETRISFKVQSPLVQKRTLWEHAETVFNNLCITEGFSDEWDAYRREDEWSPALKEAWALQSYFMHDYYLLRDGPRGVLGGRGV